MINSAKNSRNVKLNDLPLFYYHKNFFELLEFIEEHYSHVLNESLHSFIYEFKCLSKTSQCLYIRIANRKGRIFNIDKLVYDEIGELDKPLSNLRSAGFIRAPQTSDFSILLESLNKSSILKRLSDIQGISRNLKKEDYVRLAFEKCDPKIFIDSVSNNIIVQDKSSDFEFLQFLYYGHLSTGTSQLTMRDLGLVDMNDYESFEPRFNDYDEAYESFYYAREYRKVKKPKIGEIDSLVNNVKNWPETETLKGAELRDKLALKLGRLVERNNDAVKALDIFQRGESIDCMKQVVRLLIADDKKLAAKEYLEACLEYPRNDEELLFVKDLYERKFNGKKRSNISSTLLKSNIIEIDESLIGSPEKAAIQYYENLEYQAYRTENHLWRALFGLLFWDLLFESRQGTAHSPFDFLPASLMNQTFYNQNKKAIKNRLEDLKNRKETKFKLLQNSTKYYGTKNGVFRWRRASLTAINALIDHADAKSIAMVLKNLCIGYKDNKHGYPDLMILKDNQLKFVEIKAEGDQIRRNQLLRLKQLKDVGFTAEVVRIKWTIDPKQIYVIVDVETTGGRGENHRVTEIGAVKVQGGKIIDRFSTLLNPQRLIPASITRITHITNEMVKDAPLFSEIVGKFEEFLDDSIFCAHNVNFDYGFIKQEFNRIGKKFCYPKLCTCSSMRKLYKGHKSYSLANLTREYDIPLKSHHRALCDAEAATHLLFLINEKRQRNLCMVNK